MNTKKRYVKPNMTNLPKELGRAIFEQILNTPRPDCEVLEMETRKVEKELIRVRKNETVQVEGQTLDTQ